MLPLAWKSLWNRRVTSLLTILSISASVFLLLSVEKIREGTKESFSNTINQVDLIAGARGGSLPLLLYTVFRIGNATNNISYESYKTFAKHPDVLWTIPYSLGDSHKGFRVVGTTPEFFERYRFGREQRVEFKTGNSFAGVFEVVLGGSVAQDLSYKIGDSLALSHGVSEGVSFYNHDDKPFIVTGILAKTGTPIDRSLYISLEGMESLHIDWGDGAPPLPGQGVLAETLKTQKIEIQQITSFLIRTKNRVESLRLQREINTFAGEPMSAILPGVALSELWNSLSYVDASLRAVSSLVMIVGLCAMLIALYSTLNERRREMAILRAMGASPRFVGTLMLFESLVLTFAGALLGVIASYVSIIILRPWIQTEWGLFLPIRFLSLFECLIIGVLLLGGLLVGLIPSFAAYKKSLVDGLTIKT